MYPFLLAKSISVATLFISFFIFLLSLNFAAGITRHYTFNVEYQNMTRLCHTTSVRNVNGLFPGPVLLAREGDRVIIKVSNYISDNVTIHWHGIRQLQTCWADGPAYITQCPIQTGQTYTYNFTIIGQRGTLFWHGHISWLRATVYGPIIILPRENESYPFEKPYDEVLIMFGEWYNEDPEAVIHRALRVGKGPTPSNAYTINGLPGLLYHNCSSEDTFKLKVKPSKTYLLRLINADINKDLWFGIANHTLTVVEADANYVKPFEVDTLVISSGQTYNVLLKTKPMFPNATFMMAARPYICHVGVYDNSTTSGLLEYEDPLNKSSIDTVPLYTPILPPINSTDLVANFTSKLRSLANSQYPINVPKTVDRKFFFTVGLGSSPCPLNTTCVDPHRFYRFAGFINNVSFVAPSTAILQAYYFNKSKGVYTTDFPTYPPFPFDYTGAEPNNSVVTNGTKVVVLPFNTNVELVFQDTSILGFDSHPLHLHGYDFFVVGQGFGNYDPHNDPKNFNLVDPVKRNTVGVPSGGWVAIRFLADNPGVWYMHCHVAVHQIWGLRMAWIVLDGKEPNQKLPPPPSDFPKCWPSDNFQNFLSYSNEISSDFSYMVK